MGPTSGLDDSYCLVQYGFVKPYRRHVALSVVAVLVLVAGVGCGSSAESVERGGGGVSGRGADGLAEPSVDESAEQCPGPVDVAYELGPDTVLSDRDVSDLRDAYFDIYPQFDAVSISGSGSRLVDLPERAWSGVVHFSVGEGSRFAACTVSVRGEKSSAIVTSSGPLDRTVAYGLDGTWTYASYDPLDDIKQLYIDADGDWTIDVSSIKDLRLLNVPVSGVGDEMFFLDSDDQTVTVGVEDGQEISVVQYYNYATPRLEIDTSISSRRDFSLDGGRVLIIVETSGPWRID